ncbi:MAG: PH domain-containing protein [Bacteroides sp.]|nr:PH domain-containing protein [Bacillota bacterium]MCM1393679.1 PH domain-containing protein [[Eubacterium] siraeum]MCM1455222.1 PH domain-containing protein [Bacteroides sp.]
MSYAKNNLMPDEKILGTVKFSLLKAVPKIIWSVLILIFAISCFVVANNGEIHTIATVFGVVLLILSILPVLVAVIRIKCNELAITDRRIIGKSGVVAIHVVDLRLDKIDTVTINATFWGRLLNYNSIHISGSGDKNVHNFDGIKNGAKVKNMINSAIENYNENQIQRQAEKLAKAMNG